MSHCPKCSVTLPNPKAKFCPRCGANLPEDSGTPHSTFPPHAPIRLEKRGSLWNIYFLISIGILIASAIVASNGNVRVGLILLVIGLPCLVITTILSLEGKL